MLAETDSKNQLLVWYSMATTMRGIESSEQRVTGVQKSLRFLLANIVWSAGSNERFTQALHIPRLCVDSEAEGNIHTLQQHIREGGNGIIFANHISALDIPYTISTVLRVLGPDPNVGAMPVALKHFHGVKGVMYKGLGELGIIPVPVVNPSDTTTDKQTQFHLTKQFLETMGFVLKGERNIVGLFPEGTRTSSGELKPFQKGVDRLVRINPERTQLLPVGIIKNKREMHIRAGHPFFMQDLFEGGIIPRETEAVTRLLKEQLEKLLR